MPTDPPDPTDEIHRLLDRQQALTASWALPPLILGGAALGALLVAELPELALALGIAALLSGAVAALTAWERLRKIRAVRAILESARREERDRGER